MPISKGLEQAMLGGGELWHRQLGLQPHIQFTYNNYCDTSMLHRLKLERVLRGHGGCVNSVAWNKTGSRLLSGSDDQQLLVWDCTKGRTLHRIPTRHTNNIFSVNFMPESCDERVVSAAGDGRVIVHDINKRDRDSSAILTYTCHSSRVKRVCVHDSEPWLIWSAGEDGRVQQWDTREPGDTCECNTTLNSIQSCKHTIINLNLLVAEHAEVKSLCMNPVRAEQMAVGGTDAVARLFDRRYLPGPNTPNHRGLGTDHYCCPGHLNLSTAPQSGQVPFLNRNPVHRQHQHLCITHLTYSADGHDLLVNVGGEHLYLFALDKYASEARPLRLAEHILAQGTSERGSTGQSEMTPPPRLTNGYTAQPVVNVERRSPSLCPRAECLKRQANVCFAQENFVDAVALYSEALKYAPTSSLLLANRATALRKRAWSGDIYEALRNCVQVLQQDSTHVKALFRLAQCLHELGIHQLALQALNIFQDRFPVDFQNASCGRLLQQVKEAVWHSELDAKEQSSASSGVGATMDSGQANDANNNSSRPSLSTSNRRRRHSMNEQSTSTQRTRQTEGGPTTHETRHKQMARDYSERFCGHCNTTTDIKEAAFLGDKFVCAGSDCGSIFVWSRVQQQLVAVIHGADQSIVNCLQPHPTMFALASAGIESTIKIWTPSSNGEIDFSSASRSSNAAEPESASAAFVRDQNFGPVAAANQRRMHADPLEALLMNIGYNMGDHLGQGGDDDEDGDGPRRGMPGADGGDENTVQCRQQ